METKAVMRVWLFLLVPWIFIGPLFGMAFDAGHTPDIYLTVGCAWTYPLVVLVASLLKRKWPRLVWLPVLNFLLPLTLGPLIERL